MVVLEEVRPEWPAWAKQARDRFARPEDQGIGDTVQRMASWFGGEWFKAIAKQLGLPCGCTERQAEWNKLYPYED